MIIYREATPEDATSIAMLHAQSWQTHYRGIMSDAFLDGPVKQDRLDTWTNRLEHPKDNQYILLAEENNRLCGFACALADHDPVFGTLLDNLHVRTSIHGKGTGRHLITAAAKWAYNRNPDAQFYLWVFEKNTGARKFYEKLGAVNHQTLSMENPDGTFSQTCRYVWTDVKKLSGLSS